MRRQHSAVVVASAFLIGVAGAIPARAQEVRLTPPEVTVRLHAFVEARFTYSAANATHAQDFDVAHARFAAEGTVGERGSYFLQVAASTLRNSNGVSLLDGWMGLAPSPRVKLKVGRFVLPYSRALLTHPGSLLLPDFSAAEYAFGMNRSIGVQVAVAHAPFTVSLTGANCARGADATGQRDGVEAPAVLARLELDLAHPYGYLETSPSAAQETQLSVGLAAAHNRTPEASTLQSLLPGDRSWNVTTDMGLRARRVTLQAAGFYRHVRRAVGGNGDDLGYYAQAGWYAVPASLETALRVSTVAFDETAGTASTPDATEYSTGINWYLQGHQLKIQADFSLIDRDGHGTSRDTEQRWRAQTQILF